MTGRRISGDDTRLILKELEAWRDGQLGTKLKWEILEKRFGFSRQALQAHSEIKVAFGAAKDSLRNGLLKTRKQQTQTIDSLTTDADTLKAIIADYKAREEEWQKRWQRIAYHIRGKGLNLSEIDRGLTGNAKAPNAQDTDNILRPFDRPMPPTGRK